MDYILGKKQKGCFFCKIQKEEEDRKNLILRRKKRAFVVMNRFPYSNGHLMIVPKRHCLDLGRLDDREFKELSCLLEVSVQVLKASLHPAGFNIGINIGKAGGAGEEHIHFHIVPRWVGDTNFMPILGETKTIPEYLDETYQKLHAVFRDLSRKGKGRRGGREK